MPQAEKVLVPVYDLTSAALQPGLDVRVTLSNGHSLTATTDSYGYLAVPTGAQWRAISPAGASWETSEHSVVRVLAARQWDVYRIIKCAVKVVLVEPSGQTATDAFTDKDPLQVQMVLDTVRYGPESVRGWQPMETLKRLRRSRLRRVGLRGADVGKSGTSTQVVRLPLVAGQFLVAWSQNWGHAIVPIPAYDVLALPEQLITVRIQRARTIEGRIIDSSGKPIRNAVVSVHGSKSIPADEIPWFEIQLGQHAFSVIETPERKDPLVLTGHTLRTDENGRFHTAVPYDGFELVIAPHADGYRMKRTVTKGPQGDAGTTQHYTEIALERSDEGDFVTLMNSGLPLTSTAMTVSELGPLPTLGFSIANDKRGRLPTAWLILGKRYTLFFVQSSRKPVVKSFTWNGQDSLELRDLPDH